MTGRTCLPAALAAALCAWVGSARAGVIEVPAGGDVAAAVAAANDGDVVQLASGTHTLASTVTIGKPVTVRGRFAGCTRITASGTGYSLFKLTNAGAVLERVTLTGATASTGAGVYVTGGTVQDAIISGNTATAGGNAGAGVWLAGANSALRRCRVENNTTSGYGGGVYFTNGATIESCSISVNSASWGGGLYGDNSSVPAVVSHCNVWSNAGPSGGADVYDYATSTQYKYYSCYFGAGVVKNGNSLLIDCVTGGAIGADMLQGKARPITDEPKLTNLDLNGRSFHSSAPSVGCTEYETDGLDVVWTGVAFGGIGTTVDATFACENKSDEMTIATALYDPGGTMVGGSDTGADFSFTVTDAVGVYTLVVTMAAGGETREFLLTPFSGCPAELHVSPTGASVSPYATEETALADVQQAVNFAVPGTVVVVHDGAYPLNETLRIERPVTVRSANGRDKTTLKPASGKSIRLVYVNHAEAVFDGFTLTGGKAGTSWTGNVYGSGVYVGKQGGTVDNCLIEKCGAGHGMAACLAATNAVLRRTIVRQNEVGGIYGSVYLTNGGVVDNCLIYGNKTAYGAGVYIEENGSRGVILNSTIVDNVVTGSGADLYVYKSGSAITNSIVGGIVYNGGVNTSEKLLRTALFKDKANGDYTLLADETTVIDQGVAYDGMPTTDVYGNRRVSGAGVDIGAVEFKADELLVEVAVDKTSELFSDGLTFTLTPTVSGAKGEVSVDWKITTDHGRVTALTATTGNEPLVFAPTGPGAFTVAATATDSSQTSEPIVFEKLFVAGAAEVFVDEKGGNAFPYATAADGAHDFDDAWDLVTTGSVVHVAAGLYRPSKQMALTGPIQVLGAGRDVTTLRLKDGANDRVAELDDPAALIRGCTLSGGRLGLPSGRHGCGVRFGAAGGTVEDCRIADNKTDGYLQLGGGVYFALGSAGVLRRSVVDGNVATAADGYGGGIYTPGGGVVENCLIVSNKANWGGGVYLDGALYATNCTIAGNSGKGQALVGWGNWKNARMANLILRPQLGVACPVEDAAKDLSGIFSHCHIERVGHPDQENSVVAFPEVNGNTHVVPGFVDEAGGDYHLQRRSPLVKAGLYAPWMKRAADLDGRKRASGGMVDIGCYQRPSDGLRLLVR